MQALSARDMLDIWEQGQGRPPVHRALVILAAACPEASIDTLADLSIGQRDVHLLTLREWAFGSRLANLAACPACGGTVEFTFSTGDIRVDHQASGDRPLSVSAEGYQVCFRAPNSHDLLAISGRDAGSLQRQLISRCVQSADLAGEAVPIERLTDEVLTAVAAGMAEADPQADVQLSLECLHCGHEWPALFDIVTFFWCEIDAWARRMLGEVHTLASAYGWPEADILAMSPYRRQFYLEMVSS